ncbi:response regulator [Candidatus Dojkabacteria bacterium]|uniref:Response regulator n=1 Tax=Candidatus Dojkabacteria bacterium TaxID=2099670 RepID=A0A5C7J5Q4_9BACT|nr:MAG: response regulator [Candidatus Dojkabacteria bacterium]
MITPALYMPTVTALIDDDSLYIENIADLLPSELSPRVVEPEELHLGNEHLFCLATEKNTHNYSSKSSLLKYFKDNIKNPPVSTLVVDYGMRPIDGLEILKNINSPFIQKILISNLVSKERVIEAINSGIIHCYISKIDQNFIDTLAHGIKRAQINFFRQLSTLFPDFYCEENPLLEPESSKIFSLIQTQHNAQYYEPIDSFKRFIFYNDRFENLVNLEIVSEEHISALISGHHGESTPNEIIELIKSGAAIPCFMNDRLPDGKVWHKFLRASHILHGKKKYFYSIHKDLT